MRAPGGIFAIACLAALTGSAVAAWSLEHWWRAPGSAVASSVLVVRRGGVLAIGEQLAAGGIVDRPRLFALTAMLDGLAGRLQAGEYAFPARVSPAAAARLLAGGHTIVHRLVIPEGWSSAEAVAIVAGAPALGGTVGDVPPEGSLEPDTYFYQYGDDRRGLLERMMRARARALAAAWARRAAGLPLTSPQAALTLASIVEKETAIEAERPWVACVFYNRLRQGMPLQSDPTVEYALTAGRRPLGRPLSRADLSLKSPYNTYLARGLPPGPIDNPGRAALAAVLHPATIDALYFVADGSGGHRFAASLAEHARNVAKWRVRGVAASAGQGQPAPP